MEILPIVSEVYFFVTEQQVNLRDGTKSLSSSKHKGTYNKLPEFRMCRSEVVAEMHLKLWLVYGTYQQSDIGTEIWGKGLQ